MTAVRLVRSAEGARVAGAIALICPSSRRLRPAHEPMRTLYYSFSLNDAFRVIISSDAWRRPST